MLTAKQKKLAVEAANQDVLTVIRENCFSVKFIETLAKSREEWSESLMSSTTAAERAVIFGLTASECEDLSNERFAEAAALYDSACRAVVARELKEAKA